MVMVTLVLTGECLYLLMYILRRDFGNAMVEALGISHTQLGTLSAVYGAVALVCYFPGGFVADRYSARRLMIISSVMTAIGGFFLATYPPYDWLLALYAGWGLSTILTFWAALVKVTRAWGGEHQQGRAFGFLDGGRALMAAVTGSVGLGLFAMQQDPSEGLRMVILLYAGLCLGCSVLVFSFITDAYDTEAPESPLKGLGVVLRKPATWWHGLIIFCAYAGYWGTFNLASYAGAGFGMDHASAARVSVLGAWFGPLVTVGAGFIAEKAGPSRAVIVAFVVLGLSLATLAATTPSADAVWVLWLGAITSSAAAFALRGLYYTLLHEADVPAILTGTTVGVVSVLGYTPDIIVPPSSGWLVDNLPGASGYRVLFAALAAGCLVGIYATLRLRRRGPV